MTRARNERPFLKRALGLSIGLHLLIAPAFVAALALVVDFGRSNEAIRVTALDRSGASLLVLRHRSPAVRLAAAPRPVARPPARERLRVALAKPVFHKLPTSFKPRVPVVSRQAPSLQTASSSAAHSAFETRRKARAIALTDVTPVQTPPVTPAPRKPAQSASQGSADTVAPAQANAEPAQAAPASARSLDVPMGGWGQNDKPVVADDAALDDLRARFHTDQPIDVVVDESGHALKVIVPPSLPSDARVEIEKALLSLHYLPAECNGMHCNGTLQFVL